MKLEAKTRLQAASGPVTMTFAHREPVTFKSETQFDRWVFSKGNVNGMARSGRIGDYSVTTMQDGDVGVTKIYDWDADSASGRITIPKTSKFYESSKRDRMRQISAAKQALQKAGHPMLKEVMLSAQKELDYFKAQDKL